MKNNAAFLTAIYPMREEYLLEFFKSLKKQTFKRFDVIVLNDGYEGFGDIKNDYSDLNIIELECSSSPVKNREVGIKYIVEHDYDVIIFGDSDDYFSENRVQVCIEKLAEFDIVVNDLSLFNEDGIYNEKYITNRISNNTEIDLEFIKRKNLFGMSNTAVRVSAIGEIDFQEGLDVFDWYFFSVMLLNGGRAVFINEAITFYRQYENNMIGISRLSEAIIKKGIKVKLKHYSLMLEMDESYSLLYKNIVKLSEKCTDSRYLDKVMNQDLFKPLWWEEIELL